MDTKRLLYKGRPVEDLTREELIKALYNLQHQIELARHSAEQTAQMHDAFRKARESRRWAW